MGEKIASLYAEISGDTSKLNKGLVESKSKLGGFASELNNTVKRMTGFDLASLSIAGALTGIAVAAKKAIDSTVAYTKEVRDMTYFTGQSAEEISRIVQVADDWGIEIGQVRTALRYLTKNGIEPSIDSLAKLADEYVATADKTQFAEKAAKLLGREWTTLIPILAKGGDALRKQAEGVDDNLIVTEKMIDTARDYELALDSWQEQSEKLTYHWGTVLLPKGAAVLQLLTDMTSLDMDNWFMEAADASANFLNKFIYGKETVEDFSGAASRFAKDDQVAGALDDMGVAADTAATKIKGVVTSLSEVSAASMAADALNAVNQAFEDGLIGQAEYDKLTYSILDNFTNLTDKEIANIQNLGYLNKAFADGVLPVSDLVKITTEYAIALGKIPRDVTTTFHINYEKQEYKYGPEPGPSVPVPGGGTDPGLVPGGATGLHMVVPPGFPGDTYTVRASSGEKVDITPSGQSSGGDVYVVQNFYDQGAAALGMAYVESLRSKRLDAGMGV